MTQKPLEPAKVQSILKSIHNGMDVLDSKGDKIGTVDDVYFGADSDEMQRHGAGAATAPDPSIRKNDLVTNVARAVFDDNDDLPEEMRQRLLNNGYIRLDTAGLFASDRYILPEQIARIQEDHVHLTAAKDELLKK